MPKPPHRPRHGDKLKRNAGISLDPSLIERIDAIAGKGKRSQWCEAALLKAVELEEQEAVNSDKLTQFRVQAQKDLENISQAFRQSMQFPFVTKFDELIFTLLKETCQTEPGEPNAFYQEALEYIQAQKALEELARETGWDHLCFWVEEEPSTLPIRRYYRLKTAAGRKYVQISKSPLLLNSMEDGETEFEADEFFDLAAIDPQLLDDFNVIESVIKEMSYQDAEIKGKTILESFGFKVALFSDSDWELID